MSYLPFQAEGIRFALEHEQCLIADEMGLGKTIQAIGVSNALPETRSILVVCPTSLKLNWQQEWEKWCRKRLTVSVANGSFPDTDVVIVSYEQLGKYFDEIHERDWDLLIADEAHKLKNDKAQRTINLLGKRRWTRSYGGRGYWVTEVSPVHAQRRIFLTGTPLLNRPAELWTLVHALDPEGLGKFKSHFEQRYCDAHMGYYGWDNTGASNLDELSRRLSSFTIRRTKAQVLPQLPLKRTQVIVLETPSKLRKLLEKEKREYEKLESTRLSAVSAEFREMSAIRKETALAKVPFVVTHIQNLLEETDKLVVMAHHHEVIDAISDEFDDAVVIDGRTSVKLRQAAVNRFQNDKKCKLLICSIQVGGTGFTLTAADTVVFAELDWVPGNLTQAEDRLHRIGQRKSVLVQHIVLDGSLDANLVHKVVRKQSVIRDTLARVN